MDVTWMEIPRQTPSRDRDWIVQSPILYLYPRRPTSVYPKFQKQLIDFRVPFVPVPLSGFVPVPLSGFVPVPLSGFVPVPLSGFIIQNSPSCQYRTCPAFRSRRNGRQGVAAPHSTVEAGEPTRGTPSREGG